MTTSRAVLFACLQCRDRRRKCDKQRPRCSPCAERNLECIYPSPASDTQPSPLVQELASIRERLDYIRDSVDKPTPTHQSLAPDLITLAAREVVRFPVFGIKSPSLMQMVGLSPNLSSLLYRLEKPSADTADSPREPTLYSLTYETSTVYRSSPRNRGYMDGKLMAGNDPRLLHSFYDQVHLWYPVLHPTFTHEFYELRSHGFPSSVKSCLSLLVVSIGFLLVDPRSYSPSDHFDAACSMLPIVLQDDSVTSTQCLVLFSIYFSCLARPRQAYKYIQLASLRVEALFRMQTIQQRSPDWQLANRLYWAIFMIRSEISTHFHLSRGGRQATNSPIPLPGDAEASWQFPPEVTSSPDAYSCPAEAPFFFREEIELQQLLDRDVNPTSKNNPLSSPLKDRRQLLVEWYNSLPDTLRSCLIKKHDEQVPYPERVALIRAKYYAYEVSLYWPAIYHIMATGLPDPELLPYCPLFFESTISFLAAATAAIQLYPPKVWPLCASVFTVSLVAMRASEIPVLKGLMHLSFTSSLVSALNSLEHVSRLSPSVEHMRHVLEERLRQVNII